MKQFKFRLQAVLEQRERLEKQAVQTYSQAKRAEADAEGVLMDLQTLRQHLIDGLTNLRLNGCIDPQEQLVYQEYIRHIREDITRQEARVAELSRLAEKFRISLIDASTGKKAIDQLRERSLNAHYQQALKAEADEIDEIASMRHQYKKALDEAA